MAVWLMWNIKIKDKGWFEMKTNSKHSRQDIRVFLALISVLLIAGFGLSGCAKEVQVTEKSKPVRTTAVEEKEEAVSLEYFGITNSQDIKKYSLKVSGKVARIYVEKGQKIKKGQLLAELDKSDLQYALKAAEYTLKQAQSAAADANDLYEKVKVLQENGASSQRDLDLAKLDRDVKAASYNLAAVDVDYKSSMLRDASLYADMDGYVVELLFKEGEVAGAGYPIVAARSGQQVVNVGLNQEDIQKVKVGTKAVIIPEGNGKIEAAGEITLIDQAPDLESRTYNVQIKITNVPEDYDFYLGSACRVRLEAGTAKGIWISLASIQNDGQDYVYVVEENRALRKNVKILDTVNTSVRVEGISPGDRLVTAGMKNLKEGTLVAEGADEL